jgi:hypothetical protein
MRSTSEGGGIQLIVLPQTRSVTDALSMPWPPASGSALAGSSAGPPRASSGDLAVYNLREDVLPCIQCNGVRSWHCDRRLTSLVTSQPLVRISVYNLGGGRLTLWCTQCSGTPSWSPFVIMGWL